MCDKCLEFQGCGCDHIKDIREGYRTLSDTITKKYVSDIERVFEDAKRDARNISMFFMMVQSFVLLCSLYMLYRKSL